MQFFIDTANVAKIKEAWEAGLIDGVTTNPSLVAKEGKEFRPLIKEICDIVKGPVNAECVTLTAKEIVREAQDLARIAPNIVVKIPMIPEGLKAVKILTQDGVRTNVTLCFSPTQALLAAKAGATYVSPFVGRFDDISQAGMEIVHQILEIYNNYDFKTQVIVASIRNPLHVVEAALMGAHVATIPPNVLEQLMKHPLTDIGLEKFLADWKKVK